jgi:hypothetical protein
LNKSVLRVYGDIEGVVLECVSIMNFLNTAAVTATACKKIVKSKSAKKK